MMIVIPALALAGANISGCNSKADSGSVRRAAHIGGLIFLVDFVVMLYAINRIIVVASNKFRNCISRFECSFAT
ncbi:MAG: hypothetical protein A2168_06610 [Planctomycetes bacterium RBG_13_50_24]|nr:MAG: hypothetical protein A2168_06610 [Planctomycetes bacterium RBG_13_50_24]